jgi:hypothetical protein
MADRLWEKIEVGAHWECWPFAAKACDRDGYGQLWADGVTYKAHRLVWEYTYGPIPPGLHVLHHCDNPSCCNPEHLFIGTDLDNNQDMVAKGRHGNLRKTHCPQNHLYSGDNLYIRPSGRRGCRQCIREERARRYERDKAR